MITDRPLCYSSFVQNSLSNDKLLLVRKLSVAEKFEKTIKSW